MVAFVPTAGGLVRYSGWAPASPSSRRSSSTFLPHVRALPRRSRGLSCPSRCLTTMAEEKKNLWKENPFTGGFPGGETFFLKWSKEGMKGDVPDLDKELQPGAAQVKKEPKRKPRFIDTLEFFKDFQGKKGEQVKEKPTEETEEKVEEEAVAEPAYERYFPKGRRNLAPMIDIVYEKDSVKDRVGVSMQAVESSATDVYYPKYMKNKAPMIEIMYTGSLATSGVRLSMADVKGLPTLPPPAKPGETVTVLTPGGGGGLKLDFSVQGEGPVNVYSDPRCSETYDTMISSARTQ